MKINSEEWHILIPSYHLDYVKELRKFRNKFFLLKLHFSKEKLNGFEILNSDGYIADVISRLNNLKGKSLSFNLYMKMYYQCYDNDKNISITFSRIPTKMEFCFPVVKNSIITHEQWKYWSSKQMENIHFSSSSHCWKVFSVLQTKWKMIDDDYDLSFIPSK